MASIEEINGRLYREQVYLADGLCELMDEHLQMSEDMCDRVREEVESGLTPQQMYDILMMFADREYILDGVFSEKLHWLETGETVGRSGDSTER